MKAPIKTATEFNKLYAHAAQMRRPAMYRLLILLSEKLGLRPLELSGLHTSWFRSGELRIPIGYSKRKKGRSIPVNGEIMFALHEHMAGRTGQVFLNRQSEAFTAKGMSEAFQRLYREAGVEGSCYSGRRTMATQMCDRGVNIAIISKVLGHSSIATTQEYIGVTEAMMRKAMFA